MRMNLNNLIIPMLFGWIDQLGTMVWFKERRRTIDGITVLRPGRFEMNTRDLSQ